MPAFGLAYLFGEDQLFTIYGFWEQEMRSSLYLRKVSAQF